MGIMLYSIFRMMGNAGFVCSRNSKPPSATERCPPCRKLLSLEVSKHPRDPYGGRGRGGRGP